MERRAMWMILALGAATAVTVLEHETEILHNLAISAGVHTHNESHGTNHHISQTTESRVNNER